MKCLLVVLAVVACGPAAPVRTPAQRTEASAPVVAALQASKFDDAARQATAVLASDPGNARAAAVRAIATYQVSGNHLVDQLIQIIEKSNHLEFFDHAGGRAAWQGFLDQLAAIDRDLAVVAADPQFSLELCLACWTADWNHNGQIDEHDTRLFELEFDGKGGEIPQGDPRRRPTFRFDVGDADWARAMIAFQRAVGELVLAYKWSDLDKLFRAKDAPVLTLKLIDKPRVTRARELILAGLDYADRSRAAYLAETDDDREWVPNPRQHNHPMPLEVDDALYTTWAAVTGDIRRLLTSEDGLSIRQFAGLLEPHLVELAPDAYIDFGRLLSDPRDIVFDFTLIDRHEDASGTAAFLRGMLQSGYQTSMHPSALTSRLGQMKSQLDRDEDTFERKLRYLLWLN
ncbi:MAG TPA: hypothetical protein VH165_14520 [Kofleriaceae bacterium]|jgi:hypothetical protein|nr:hypothetical protein [Kofleriaceae bacterium]